MSHEEYSTQIESTTFKNKVAFVFLWKTKKKNFSFEETPQIQRFLGKNKNEKEKFHTNRKNFAISKPKPNTKNKKKIKIKINKIPKQKIKSRH